MTRLALDHLVVAARTLAEGLDWCEATLGLRPDAGGSHVFMGTHNRVFALSSKAFPRSYLEIIAIDPALAAPGRPRWFDLDAAALQAQLAAGPQLVHWVARVDDVAATQTALREAGIDVGNALQAERGALRWRIWLRADGGRPLAGAAPALIEWDGAHPTDAMADSGVRLEALSVGNAALREWLPETVRCDADRPLCATLATPRGPITLSSPPPKE
jgi:hypothetical protein